MHYDNKNLDKKLQELESQSLPDLSKMDEQWQQMRSLLQPAVGTPKNLSKKISWWIVADALVAGLFLLTYLFFESTKTNNQVQETAQNRGETTRLVVDTTGVPPRAYNKDTILLIKPSNKRYDRNLILKARTSSGRDTMIIGTPVNSDGPKKLLDKKASLDLFFRELEKRPQEFAINPKKDTLLNGRDGTALFIPAHTFAGGNEVVITMKEFYSYEDIISNKLSTCSNGRQLVTGGMIHVMATVNGKPADIQPGKAIRWFVPDTTAAMSGMELFSGQVNNNTATLLQEFQLESYRDTVRAIKDFGTINWIPQQRSFIKTYLETSVKVLNLQNKPFKTRETKNGMIGFFYIADKPEISRNEMREELKEKYGYHKVKIRKSKPNNFFRKITPSALRRTDEFSDRLGDSAWLPKKLALMYKLKATDSGSYVLTGIGTESYPFNRNFDLNSVANRFSVDIRTLGWINCDRFYRDDRPRVEYYVDLKDTASNYYTVLVFDRFKSMIPGLINGNKVLFANIPEGESAKLISIGIRDGRTVAAMENIAVSNTTITGLRFEETTPAGFKKEVSEMDN